MNLLYYRLKEKIMGELPRHKLSDAELQEALKSLPGWKAEKDKLHREYNFDDFVET